MVTDAISPAMANELSVPTLVMLGCGPAVTVAAVVAVPAALAKAVTLATPACAA